jgi:hypothetical protein
MEVIMSKSIHNANKREMLQMAKKSGSQKQYTYTDSEGKETVYTFQHPGVRGGVQLRGRAKDATGNLDEEKYYEELMKKVVVDPKNNWEYWEDNEGFQDVMKEASTFLVG